MGDRQILAVQTIKTDGIVWLIVSLYFSTTQCKKVGTKIQVYEEAVKATEQSLFYLIYSPTDTRNQPGSMLFFTSFGLQMAGIKLNWNITMA